MLLVMGGVRSVWCSDSEDRRAPALCPVPAARSRARPTLPADFFHDFLYYSERPVGTVGFHGDEIELQNDPVAQASGRFIEKPEFLAEWAKPGRVLVLACKV